MPEGVKREASGPAFGGRVVDGYCKYFETRGAEDWSRLWAFDRLCSKGSPWVDVLALAKAGSWWKPADFVRIAPALHDRLRVYMDPICTTSLLSEQTGSQHRAAKRPNASAHSQFATLSFLQNTEHALRQSRIAAQRAGGARAAAGSIASGSSSKPDHVGTIEMARTAARQTIEAAQAYAPSAVAQALGNTGVKSRTHFRNANLATQSTLAEENSKARALKDRRRKKQGRKGKQRARPASEAVSAAAKKVVCGVEYDAVFKDAKEMRSLERVDGSDEQRAAVLDILAKPAFWTGLKAAEMWDELQKVVPLRAQRIAPEHRNKKAPARPTMNEVAKALRSSINGNRTRGIHWGLSRALTQLKAEQAEEAAQDGSAAIEALLPPAPEPGPVLRLRGAGCSSGGSSSSSDMLPYLTFTRASGTITSSSGSSSSSDMLPYLTSTRASGSITNSSGSSSSSDMLPYLTSTRASGSITSSSGSSSSSDMLPYLTFKRVSGSTTSGSTTEADAPRVGGPSRSPSGWRLSRRPRRHFWESVSDSQASVSDSQASVPDSQPDNDRLTDFISKV